MKKTDLPQQAVITEKVMARIKRIAKRSVIKFIEETLGFWPLLDEKPDSLIYRFHDEQAYRKAASAATKTANTAVYLNNEKMRLIIVF